MSPAVTSARSKCLHIKTRATSVFNPRLWILLFSWLFSSFIGLETEIESFLFQTKEETSKRMNKASILEWGCQGCTVEDKDEVYGFTNILRLNCLLKEWHHLHVCSIYCHFIFIYVHINEVLLNLINDWSIILIRKHLLLKISIVFIEYFYCHTLF